MVSRFINATDRKSLRRALRRSATVDECLLWNELKGSKLQGRKFRRQTSIGPFIVDFYCPSENLVVELDGASHDSDRAEVHDVARASYLQSAGFQVLRLVSGDVRRNLEGVLTVIARAFGASGGNTPPRQAAPATPPRGGGE